MSVKEQYWKYSLITIILGLGLILFIKMSPFMGGILGACTIYIMVRKQMFYLTQEKHFKKSITANDKGTRKHMMASIKSKMAVILFLKCFSWVR